MQKFLEFANQNRIFLYGNLVVFFILLNLFSSQANCRLDVSRGKMNSLSESTERVANRLSEPLLIEAFITKDVPGEIKSMLDPIQTQLDELARLNPKKIQVKQIDPDDEESKQLAEARGIQGIPVEQAKVDEISQRLGFFGVYLQVGDQSTVISLVDEGRIIEDFEYRVLREVKRMTVRPEKSSFGFIRLPGTLDFRRWQSAQDQDKDNLFAFRSLFEREMGATEDVDLQKPVSSDIQTLILFGLPRLENLEAYHLDQFLMRGGNLICFAKGFDFQLGGVDPRMAQLGLGGSGGGFATVPVEDLRRFNETLSRYGILVKGEILFEPTLAAPEMDVQGQYLVKLPNKSWAVYSKQTGNIIDDDFIGTKYANQVVIPWFSGLDVQEARQPEMKYKVLVESSEDAISRESSSLNLKDIQTVGELPSDKKVQAPQPIVVLAEGRLLSAFTEDTLPKDVDKNSFKPAQSGESKSTIVVVGSPYLVSDVLLRNEPNLEIFKLNQSFVTNLLEGIGGDTDLLAARSKVRTIDTIHSPPALFEALGMSAGTFETLFKFFHIFTLPVALGVFGALRMLDRNRRKGLETTKGKAA